MRYAARRRDPQVGYGDLGPKTARGKLITSVFVLYAMVMAAQALGILTAAAIEKAEKLIIQAAMRRYGFCGALFFWQTLDPTKLHQLFIAEKDTAPKVQTAKPGRTRNPTFEPLIGPA